MVEPTSGLDSFSALQLTQVLHKVANAGSSVLFTIHQPASEIFEAFDHLILLNKGRVMYQGSVADVPNYFGLRGNPLPSNYNPADWIMMVAQKNTEEELDAAGFFPKDERNLGEASRDSKVSGDVDALGNSLHGKKDKSLTKRVTFFTQIRLLYTREFQNLGRDKASLGEPFFHYSLFLLSSLGTMIHGCFSSMIIHSCSFRAYNLFEPSFRSHLSGYWEK